MKIIVSAAMLFLLLISMSTTAFNIQPVKTESKTIVVPYDYPTIQQAINAADTGDTIYVRSGTYQECIVVNKTVAIVGENKENTIIQENYYASIDASESVVNIVNDGVSIINFTIRNGLYGIRLNSSNNIINGNNVTDNRYGIYLDFSSNNTIYKNSIGDHFVWGPSSYGIYLHESLNNSICGNTFYHSSYCIYLDQSFDNNIFRNDVSSCWTGIYISSSSNNSLYENTIVNQPYGVGISWSSNNRIFANNLTSNDFGICIENSLDNMFYHNSIVNSRLDQVETDLSANVWDDGYPSGGNYWSDYTGDDEKRGPRQDEFGCDGIGDTPYEIDAKNRDRYPLMNHWIFPTPPLKFVVVPAEGWQNKELFVPVWCRSVEDPGKIVLGIYNKRNMWYLVKVYKKMPDGTWLEIVPDEFLSEGPYVGPWSEKRFFMLRRLVMK
jgi:parallel beta-helix repeat protein